VGVEARRIQNGVFRAEESGDLVLEVFVDGLRSADETHRRQPEAVGVESALGRFEDARIGCEPEVIVGAKVQYVAGADLFGRADTGPLRRGEYPFFFDEAGLDDLLESTLVELGSWLKHRPSLSRFDAR